MTDKGGGGGDNFFRRGNRRGAWDTSSSTPPPDHRRQDGGGLSRGGFSGDFRRSSGGEGGVYGGGYSGGILRESGDFRRSGGGEGGAYGGERRYGGGGDVMPRGLTTLSVADWETVRSAVAEEAVKKLSLSSSSSSSWLSLKKGLEPPARPGYGSVGLRCVVKANHFLVQIVGEGRFHRYNVIVF